MSLTTVYLALGSNVGRRLEQMHAALKLLSESDVVVIAASPVYENRAIGMGVAEPFLNAVVRAQTKLDPEALMNVCFRIETQLGRVRSKAWSPRTIDIDLLVFGQLQLETERLHLPHPRITERDFVLQPFADIAPDFELHGRSVSAWLNELPIVELKLIGGELILP